MHLPKDIFENYNMNGMDFYDQPINCDKNWYEEIKLTTGQNEDYTTWCFLDYEYIKNH